jgi:hypothetical protein
VLVSCPCPYSMADCSLAPAPAFRDEFLRFLVFQFFYTIAIWVPLAFPTCGFRASSSAPDGLAVESSGCRPSPIADNR